MLLLFSFAQFGTFVGIFILNVSIFALKSVPYKAKTYTNLTALVSVDWVKLHAMIDLYNDAPQIILNLDDFLIIDRK